ncbi:MAG: phosphodiester glycosidase family protein [Gloeobacteraceae cyanobacterium ES-bin-316]|nr:phosphodiester glycosidase family protein [Ferruginibacter sp.]
MMCFKMLILNVSISLGILFLSLHSNAQLRWQLADAEFAPLPKNFHVFKSTDSLDGKPFLAYYAIADLKDKKLQFTTDTTYKRRLTPAQFYQKNNQPLLVVNSTFFSFASNQNLNIVIREGKLISYNVHSIAQRGADTLMYKHPFASAIGISKKRKADVAWTFTDSLTKRFYALQNVQVPIEDSVSLLSFEKAKLYSAETLKAGFLGIKKYKLLLKKWKVQTAVGGGPVLVQNGRVKITNNEELKFSGNAINDKHPRTLMGYTKDDKIIVMVVEGRNPGVAEGVSLVQAAKLMADLGCVEALNLDGGGSSSMLINGKETIKPSDKGLQRPVPAVFIINQKSK